MTRKFIYVCLLALALTSCREDKLKVWHGEDYVHFTPGNDDSVSAEYNFAYGETTREKYADIPVQIRLWGYLPESDFECSFVEAEGSSLPSGCEFPRTSVFRAGHDADTLWVRVRRNDDLLATAYAFEIKFEGAEDHVVAPAKYSSVVVRVKDSLPETAPAWWNTTQALGAYSPMKYRVLNIYLGRVLTSLDGYTAMGFAEEAASFKAWWKKQWEAEMYRYYDTVTGLPLYETIP